MTPFTQAGIFLIQTLFDLYLTVVLFRFLLQIIRADFYSPLSQFVVKVTNPLLLPLRRWIPGFKGIDWACLTLSLLIALVKLTLVALIQFKQFPNIIGILIWAVGDLMHLSINIFFFAVLIQVIISWINPRAYYHPMVQIIQRLTDPLMQPARRYTPSVAGFDLSPIPVLIGLQLLSILIAAPVIQIGVGLSVGSPTP